MASGAKGRGHMPPAQAPAREIRGLGRYCIRCNKSFKSDIEKAEHDRILHSH